MTDWHTYTDYLYDERRFPAVILVAGVFVILCVIGTAFTL